MREAFTQGSMKATMQAIAVFPGKPVEVNALWLNALCVVARFADHLSKDGRTYRYLAERARAGMQRFWSVEHGYLFDVIGPACRDGGGGVGDPSLRPNQLFVFSLPNRAFRHEFGEAVLKVVQDRLLTAYGPRSLAPGSGGYDGHYAGDSYHRDSVYHQGAVWPWLSAPTPTRWSTSVATRPRRAPSFESASSRCCAT